MSTKQRGKQFLKGLRTFRVTDDITSSAIKHFLMSLDCPRSLAVWLLYENGEHEQLVDLEINPLDYTVDTFRDAYVATEFLSKSKFLKLDRDLDKVALDKFYHFEEKCRLTNSRFRYPCSDRLKTPNTVWLQNAIRQKIARILGEFEYEEVVDRANWGPGASTLIKRVDASSPAKFQMESGITRDLFYFIRQPMPLWYPGWVRRLVDGGSISFQVGNRVDTVPKNAKTNRVIAVEPGLNVWFQLGVGRVISRRLRKCGVDLRYQSRNQRLAHKASIDNLSATVDMSSASDSIACAVVEDLIPPQWYSFLNICRSHFGKHDEKLIRWEKFSSMGNGFTFPLQTLIFYAIAFCCAEREGCDTSGVSVYGDDIIIPVGARASFDEMMQFFGFVVNPEKSFYSTSPFRESCGVHYYIGRDCKPVYLKDRLSSVLSVYRLANAIRRFAHRSPVSLGCDVKQQRCFTFLVRSVPAVFRLRIPDSLGDGGFISNIDEASPLIRRIAESNPLFQQWEGWLCDHVVETALIEEKQYLGILLAKLRASDTDDRIMDPQGEPAELETIDDRSRKLFRRLGLRPDLTGGGNGVAFPGVVRLRVVKSTVVQWDELGPWV
jgi:hypothetical protein